VFGLCFTNYFVPKSVKQSDIQRLMFVVDPSWEETRRWIKELDKKLSNYELSAATRINERSLSALRHGSKQATRIHQKVIWIVFCAVYHPGRCSTMFDLMTWGRFTHAARNDVGWHRGRYRGKPAPVVGKKKVVNCGADTPTGSVPIKKSKRKTPQVSQVTDDYHIT
jgi:hypothetical protein